MSEWICPKHQKKRRLVYVMTMYLRQHGLMSFISLSIPEREINLHFVNSAGLIFQSITEVIVMLSIFSYHIWSFDWTDFISKMQQNAAFCILLKKFYFLWFYHTIFKVLTTQILYPKCSRMHHFASYRSRVGMYIFFQKDQTRVCNITCTWLNSLFVSKNKVM
jgi:hypothetical protein